MIHPFNKFDGEFPKVFSTASAAPEIVEIADDIDAIGEIMIALANSREEVRGHWFALLGRMAMERAERANEIVRRLPK
jgi:hypothetical protein